MVTLKCLECSKEFEAQRSSAKFCSTKCRVDYNRKSVDEGVEIAKDFLKANANLLVEEKIDKQVENFFQLPTIDPELKGIIPAKETEKIVLPKAKGIMMGSDYLAALPKTTFPNLLIEFNSLVEDLPPIKQVEDKLYELILKSQDANLNARQSEAIRARCIYYLNGMYSGQKSKL